jgi:predicted DNA-binding transcriptional regulator AlpA
MTKLADSIAYAPRLFRAERAAAYLAMSEPMFLRLVEEGKMPAPVRIDGGVFWDRLALDAAVDCMSAAEKEENTVHAILRRGKS